MKCSLPIFIIIDRGNIGSNDLRTWRSLYSKEDIFVQDIGHGRCSTVIKKKLIHVLNPTAKFILKLCDGVHTLEDMGRASRRGSFSLFREHDVIRDVQRLLEGFDCDKGIPIDHGRKIKRSLKIRGSNKEDSLAAEDVSMNICALRFFYWNSDFFKLTDTLKDFLWAWFTDLLSRKGGIKDR